jgi:hypothetical protein
MADPRKVAEKIAELAREAGVDDLVAELLKAPAPAAPGAVSEADRKARELWGRLLAKERAGNQNRGRRGRRPKKEG